MGNKLEKVKTDLEQAKDTHSRSLEMAQEDAAEMKEIRSMISEIPRDIDSDLLDQIEHVSEQSTNEGVQHMESDVHSVLEEGTRIAEGVSDESLEQQQLSDEAADSFSNISDTRFGGSGAEGADRAREASEAFGETAEEAADSAEQAESSYEDLLLEVEG